ncbi:hypothetical protein Tco_0920797, partial [Tanacetum coccineum]
MNVQTTQITEATHEIITPVNPEVQQQSSSMSYGFISNMLNPNLDTGIDSVLNVETTSQDLPNFGSLFGFNTRLKILEDNFLEFKQTNQYATTFSSIPNIVDNYLGSKLKDAVDVAVQLKSDKLREDAQTENQDFINNLGAHMQKIIKEQVKAKVKKEVSKILPKLEQYVNDQLEAELLTRSSNEAQTSHAVATKLSELELKKILMEKMEMNKSIDRSTPKRNLYNALVEAYEADKDILDTYEDTVAYKRRQDDHDDDEEPSAGSNRGSTEGSKSHHQSAQAEEPMHTAEDLGEPTHQEFKTGNKNLPTVHGSTQPWLITLAQKKDPRDSFDELMDTPFDFSAFVMNRLNATTEKLDWHNPEGQQYPHDLRKPLPLLPNSRSRQVIQFDHFINNDLAYLCGGVSSRTYATSVTKTKAADYSHIKWIKELVPNTMWSQITVNYDKYALWGISHWGRKRQQFYGFAVNRESARDVYYRRRIIAVIKLQIVEWHGYKHLDWITVRRDDDKLYTFKEGDFKRLRLQDIEDMLLLLVQDKLTNLNVEERLAFSVSLRMFTRSMVIQRRVEDLQLGVESYQKKLNITKPDTYRSDLKRREASSAYSNPRGFIDQNKDKKNKLMRVDELHKFSDGTLNDVRTALNDRLKG